MKKQKCTNPRCQCDGLRTPTTPQPSGLGERVVYITPVDKEWQQTTPEGRIYPLVCIFGCDDAVVAVVHTPYGCFCAANKYQPRCAQHLLRLEKTDEGRYTIVEDFRIGAQAPIAASQDGASDATASGSATRKNAGAEAASSLVVVKALKAGLMCCEMLIKEGGAAACELSEEEVPLIKRALARYEKEMGRKG